MYMNIANEKEKICSKKTSEEAKHVNVLYQIGKRREENAVVKV